MTTENKNSPNTETVDTTALRIGDVVHDHGGRFELTEAIVDEQRAWDDAHAAPEFLTAQNEGPEALGKYLERTISLRSFRTKYLGPVDAATPPAMGGRAAHEWTIQGNDRRTWTREVRESPAQTSMDPAELYVRGVEWIALYDENAFAADGTVNPDSSTIQLLGHVHGMPLDHVARDVGSVRAQAGKVIENFAKAYPVQAAQVVSAATAIEAAEWTVEGGFNVGKYAKRYTTEVSHGVHDAKGRELGHHAGILEDHAGVHYVSIQATRNGERFGAYNGNMTRVEDGIDAAKKVACDKLRAARQRVMREHVRK